MLEIAHRPKVAYYDASYIATAAELGAELIADDSMLRKIVEEGGESFEKSLRKR